MPDDVLGGPEIPDIAGVVRSAWAEASPDRGIAQIDDDLEHLVVRDVGGATFIVPLAIGATVEFGEPVRVPVSASAEEAIALPNPNPTIIHAAAQVSADDVRTAYYRQAPQEAWIREFHTKPLRLIVANGTDGPVARVDVTIGDDGEIEFAQPQPVRVEYVDAATEVDESRMVYASAAESRPSLVLDPPTSPGDTDGEPSDGEPSDGEPQPAGHPPPVAAGDPPQPPAAEPDQPTKEDDMSLTEVRQRLGLADDAEETAVLAAIDELKTKADAQPDPQQVAAAVAEKDELTKEVGVLKGQVEAMSAKLAESEAEKAATIKASVLDTAQTEGKFKAHEREQWEKDYDESPAVVTRVLASIAKGAAVPVTVQGSVGNPIDVAAGDVNLPPEPEWLDGPNIDEPALAGKEN